MSCPHHYRFAQDGETEEEFATRLAAELEETIQREGPDTVAAFIAEPVMGAGGVIVPPKTYFEKIGKVCEAHDIYMISDEVICGFGRLGRNFGCEALGFRPHALSVAKALSSAYLPIAGVMIPEVMYQALLSESRKIGGFGHGFTYSGHPVAAAVAVKTLEIYARDKVFAAAAARIPQFQQHLKKLGEHPLVGEARGLGLMGGLELVADKATKRAFDPKQGVAARCVRVRRGGGADRARGGRRHRHGLPAADHQGRRGRRAVRAARPRARPHARLGEARAAAGGLSGPAGGSHEIVLMSAMPLMAARKRTSPEVRVGPEDIGPFRVDADVM